MSFWKKVKSAASTAARVAKPIAPYAIPLLAATPATLLAVKAIQRANAAKAASRQQAAQDQQVAQLDALPAKKDEDDEELMATSTSGADFESIFRVLQPFVSAAPGSVSNALAVKRERKLAAAEARRKKLEEEAAMADVEEGDVMGDLMGEDMGAPEVAALRRFAGNPLAPMRMPSESEVRGFLPNAIYRTAIQAQARQLAAGGPVTTRHFAAAQGIVNRSMLKRGLRLAIPGAAPSRRTL